METARRAGALIATGLVAAAATLADIADSIDRCYASKVLEVVRINIPFVHPCDVTPTFSPGGDVREAAEHKVAAIAADPRRMALTYATRAENIAGCVRPGWYEGTFPCTREERAAEAARRGFAVQCDEMPYYSTTTSGPGASLRLIRATHNEDEGRIHLRAFYGVCKNVSAPVPADRDTFLVAPNPAVPLTVWHCGR